ncbi:MAG: protein kinase [Verrucomicrobia bacterium]|nr:protein kinase [Verrucomicrobiota bacterium]
MKTEKLPEKKKSDVFEQPGSIGPYSILQSLGRGGMGEVYLAQDPAFGRHVALKRIRPELQGNKTILSRFLREARVASALTHPSIVPILNIHSNTPDVYYTMPYVEGETLRQILRAAREQEKSGEELSHPIGKSIPALARIFLQVCEAIAYTHSKGILHRDLKPENIIVGKYGEVMILDWGIADFIDQLNDKEEPLPSKKISGGEDLTRPGKITGTLAYMAPERLKGVSSSVQTDIYALGVILYQMLTLQLPFQRKTLASFRKLVDSEQLIDPIEMSPYRDIPHQLAEISNRCLHRNIGDRFKSVSELIAELKNYIEGRPEWINAARLDLNRKDDWQFQENILLAKHIAINRNLDATEWAELMISSASFAQNVRLEAEVRIGEKSQGIGFLLSVPESDERRTLEEGYCLWLGATSQLSRNNVKVMSGPGLFPGHWHRIAIEKIDDHVKFYLDGRLKLSFLSHLPLAGRHVGFIHKDGDFEIKNWNVSDGSHNVMVKCLAVPNAFLGQKLYDWALQEYRRIGQCFPGRMEGREALFRAGLTLLEKAKAEKEKGSQEKLYHLALKEFEKLYRTPGAPLEYLGKSLVYASLGDFEEEAKCLELALRKFPKHPLLSILKEHITYRMHESSLNHREAAYRVILLAIRHIPELVEHPDTAPLIESLQKNWEALSFLEETEDKLTQVSIQLAFWLAKSPILVEIANSLLKQTPVPETLLSNTIYSLYELDALEEAKQIPLDALSAERKSAIKTLFSAPKEISPNKENLKAVQLLLRKALASGDAKTALQVLGKVKKLKLSKEDKLPFDALEIWSYLLTGQLSEASQIFRKFPRASFNQENSPLHFPYGVWLYMKEGAKKAGNYFNATLETPYPPTSVLPSHFLANRIGDNWLEEAFFWEKKELHRQIDLFYKCVGKK